MPVESPLQPTTPQSQPQKSDKAGTVGAMAMIGLIAASLGLAVTKTDKGELVINDIAAGTATAPAPELAPRSTVARGANNPAPTANYGAPKLILPPSPVEPYTLVRIQVADAPTIDDVLVMTASDNVVLFVDVIESKQFGEFAFTGPPGTYSIRIKPQGTPALTGRVVIGRAPQPPPDPPNPPNPNVPNPPVITSAPAKVTTETTALFAYVSSSEAFVHYQYQLDGAGYNAAKNPISLTGLSVGVHTFHLKVIVSGKESSPAEYTWTIQSPTPPDPPQPPVPVPQGRYGFGPLALEYASKIPQPQRAKAVDLANNFEAVAAEIVATISNPMSAQEAVNKVSAKNAIIYADALTAEKWMPFRQAWKDRADALNKPDVPDPGRLRNLAADYADAFRETATGLRAVR